MAILVHPGYMLWLLYIHVESIEYLLLVSILRLNKSFFYIKTKIYSYF